MCVRACMHVGNHTRSATQLHRPVTYSSDLLTITPHQPGHSIPDMHQGVKTKAHKHRARAQTHAAAGHQHSTDPVVPGVLCCHALLCLEGPTRVV